VIFKIRAILFLSFDGVSFRPVALKLSDWPKIRDKISRVDRRTLYAIQQGVESDLQQLATPSDDFLRHYSALF